MISWIFSSWLSTCSSHNSPSIRRTPMVSTPTIWHWRRMAVPMECSCWTAMPWVRWCWHLLCFCESVLLEELQNVFNHVAPEVKIIILWTVFFFFFLHSVYFSSVTCSKGFCGGSAVKICLQWRRHQFNPQVRNIPWRRKLQPTLAFLSVKSHGQSLVG